MPFVKGECERKTDRSEDIGKERGQGKGAACQRNHVSMHARGAELGMSRCRTAMVLCVDGKISEPVLQPTWDLVEEFLRA